MFQNLSGCESRMRNVTVVIFNLFVDGMVREPEAKVGDVGVEMSIDNTK